MLTLSYIYSLQTKEAGKNILKTISEQRLAASSSQPPALPADLPESINNVSSSSTLNQISKCLFHSPMSSRKDSKYKM